jgi:ABC-2 type transport system permease protein
MFNALLRTRIRRVFKRNFKKFKKFKKKGPLLKIGIGLLILYMICYFVFMFGWFFYSICEPFSMANLQWFYFSIAGLVTVIFTFIFTVFSTQSLLFEAKDNDLLLAMPIPPKYILASRMTIMIIMNYAFEALIFAPAGAIYILKNQPVTALGVLFFILVFFTTATACNDAFVLFGWLVAIISARVRNKNTMTMILSVVFLAVYFAVFSRIQTYIQGLIQNGECNAALLKNLLSRFYYLGHSHCKPGFFRAYIFCAVLHSSVCDCLYASLEKLYQNSDIKKRTQKSKILPKLHLRSARKNCPDKKELRHFFGNAMYMMNGALGVVFTIAFAGVVVIKSELLFKMFAQIPNFGEYLGPFTCIILCVLATTNIITAPSVSLEGKNLWISQSSPIDSGDVLISKINMHLIVCLPSIILAALACVYFLIFHLLIRF